MNVGVPVVAQLVKNLTSLCEDVLEIFMFNKFQGDSGIRNINLEKSHREVKI